MVERRLLNLRHIYIFSTLLNCAQNPVLFQGLSKQNYPLKSRPLAELEFLPAQQSY